MDSVMETSPDPQELHWSIDADEHSDRSDAWSEALNTSFLRWSLSERVSEQFDASVRQRSFSDFRISRCRCGPTTGARTRSEVSETDQDLMAILLIQSGDEYVEIDGKGFDLTPGSILLWDSERPMKFHVRSPLDKLTLFAPADAVQSVLPFAKDNVGTLLNGRTGPGALFAQHLRTLESVGWTLSEEQLNRTMRGTLELLSQAFAAERSGEGETTYKRLLLERVRAFALSRLGDPNLTPRTIADHFQFSTRYLHMLFKMTDDTVSSWLKRERLRRCFDMLHDPSEQHRSITEIAMKWGFQDMSHFSKAFRSEFDTSPREHRARRQM